jgi:hypothetical protein
MFFIVALIILIIFFLYFEYDKIKNTENYYPSQNIPYPYDLSIQTPQSNYQDIVKKLDDQAQYKYDISVGLSPIPTIQCSKLKSKSDCNNNGCNWFGTYCSAIYPSYL